MTATRLVSAVPVEGPAGVGYRMPGPDRYEVEEYADNSLGRAFRIERFDDLAAARARCEAIKGAGHHAAVFAVYGDDRQAVR